MQRGFISDSWILVHVDRPLTGINVIASFCVLNLNLLRPLNSLKSVSYNTSINYHQQQYTPVKQSELIHNTRQYVSMRWFSHRHRTGGGPHPRGWLANKMQHFFTFFVPDNLDLSPFTLTFELGRDFCTMHLTAKFHHPTFNRLEVIVLTNKQRDWQTNRCRWKHPPRYAGG